jgi:hypothetical protein
VYFLGCTASRMVKVNRDVMSCHASTVYTVVASSDIQHFTFTTQPYLINDNKYRSLVIQNCRDITTLFAAQVLQLTLVTGNV